MQIVREYKPNQIQQQIATLPNTMRGLEEDEAGYTTSLNHQVKQELDDEHQQQEFNGFDLQSENVDVNRDCGNTFNYADEGDDEDHFNPTTAVEEVLTMTNSDDVSSQIFLDAERMAQLEREFHEQVSISMIISILHDHLLFIIRRIANTHIYTFTFKFLF